MAHLVIYPITKLNIEIPKEAFKITVISEFCRNIVTFRFLNFIFLFILWKLSEISVNFFNILESLHKYQKGLSMQTSSFAVTFNYI